MDRWGPVALSNLAMFFGGVVFLLFLNLSPTGDERKIRKSVNQSEKMCT